MYDVKDNINTVKFLDHLYPGWAIKPQEIISGVGMLEGNITLPTYKIEENIRNAIIYRPVNVHLTQKNCDYS